MMKKILVVALAATAITATSCGTSTQAPKTEQDSVAYASGVLAAARMQQQMQQMGDTTMTSDKVMEAIKDAFSDPKKAEAKVKEIQAQMAELQAYLATAQFAQQVRTQIDSTFNVGVILAGVKDTWDKKATMKPEDASNKIVSYIDANATKKEAGYLAEVDKKAGIQKSATDLRYTIETPGAGKVGDKDTLKVNYTLIDMNGKELQTTVGSEPMTVNMPSGVIPGFAEGLQLLGKGGKATLYVPSKLGYGTSAAQQQLGGQTLTFKVEVLDIIPFDSVKNAAAAAAAAKAATIKK